MSAEPSGPAAPRAVRRAATLVFALTVVVAAAAFLITQRVKHLPTPIVRFEVGPTVRVPGGRERIAVQLASPDSVDVKIVNGEGRSVATIASAVPLTASQTLVMRWDGREGTAGVHIVASGPHTVRVHAVILGPLVPAGEYHATVRLEHLGKTIPLPAYFVLERR